MLLFLWWPREARARVRELEKRAARHVHEDKRIEDHGATLLGVDLVHLHVGLLITLVAVDLEGHGYHRHRHRRHRQRHCHRDVAVNERSEAGTNREAQYVLLI